MRKRCNKQTKVLSQGLQKVTKSTSIRLVLCIITYQHIMKLAHVCNSDMQKCLFGL